MRCAAIEQVAQPEQLSTSVVVTTVASMSRTIPRSVFLAPVITAVIDVSVLNAQPTARSIYSKKRPSRRPHCLRERSAAIRGAAPPEGQGNHPLAILVHGGCLRVQIGNSRKPRRRWTCWPLSVKLARDGITRGTSGLDAWDMTAGAGRERPGRCERRGLQPDAGVQASSRPPTRPCSSATRRVDTWRRGPPRDTSCRLTAVEPRRPWCGGSRRYRRPNDLATFIAIDRQVCGTPSVVEGLSGGGPNKLPDATGKQQPPGDCHSGQNRSCGSRPKPVSRGSDHEGLRRGGEEGR